MVARRCSDRGSQLSECNIGVTKLSDEGIPSQSSRVARRDTCGETAYYTFGAIEFTIGL